MTLTAAGN